MAIGQPGIENSRQQGKNTISQAGIALEKGDAALTGCHGALNFNPGLLWPVIKLSYAYHAGMTMYKRSIAAFIRLLGPYGAFPTRRTVEPDLRAMMRRLHPVNSGAGFLLLVSWRGHRFQL